MRKTREKERERCAETESHISQTEMQSDRQRQPQIGGDKQERQRKTKTERERERPRFPLSFCPQYCLSPLSLSGCCPSTSPALLSVWLVYSSWSLKILSFGSLDLVYVDLVRPYLFVRSEPWPSVLVELPGCFAALRLVLSEGSPVLLASCPRYLHTLRTALHCFGQTGSKQLQTDSLD